MMNDIYLLDGETVYWWRLIKEARLLDGEHASQDFHTTSEAAAILREHGHIVEEPTAEMKNNALL